MYRHFGFKTLFYLTRSVPIRLPDRPALQPLFCHQFACGHSKKNSFSSSLCSLSVHRIKPDLSDEAISVTPNSKLCFVINGSKHFSSKQTHQKIAFGFVSRPKLIL